METFVILRRSGWATENDLEAAGSRSTAAADLDDDVRWLRSYALKEAGGRLGTVCVYEATDREAVRRHAAAADLPADEIIQVANVVVVEPDRA